MDRERKTEFSRYAVDVSDPHDRLERRNIFFRISRRSNRLIFRFRFALPYGVPMFRLDDRAEI